MSFYFNLNTVFYPFVPLHPGEDDPPEGEKFVVNYQGIQITTYQGDIVIEKGS